MVGSTPITAAVVVEKLLAWYVFFTVGVSYLYNFIGPRLLRTGDRSVHWLGR
jgi:hypothetical protein